ncbi:hypothetical protein B0A50_08576 [Salinomyces thailandicus]|uniref:Uncharacterized protein n=1 Tax=Salinomyces thailandicus TaxID=706561 RepID=A0A4U0TJB4_9PEZI|nr:hypothetical protein B0A50_08576 [Salinomyces thailandica]
MANGIGHCSFGDNCRPSVSTPASVVLTVDYSSTGLTSSLMIADGGEFDEIKTEVSMSLGADASKGNRSTEQHWEAVQEQISRTFEARRSDELKFRSVHLVMYGDAVDDARLKIVVRDVLAGIDPHLLASPWQRNMAHPHFAAAEGATSYFWPWRATAMGAAVVEQDFLTRGWR